MNNSIFNNAYAHARVHVIRTLQSGVYICTRGEVDSPLVQYFSARANSQLRQTRVYYVIDEGSCAMNPSDMEGMVPAAPIPYLIY